MSAAGLSGGAGEDAVPSRLDTATLELRGKPPQPIRFRRGVMIGGAAAATAALMALVWMSLIPSRATIPAEQVIRPAKNVSDALRGLPADYGAVPKLGPPLPGDLGRPILEQQRQRAARQEESAGAPQNGTQLRGADGLKAARQSGLLFRTAEAASPASAFAPALPADAVGAGSLGPAIDPRHDPNAQSRKLAFAGTADDRSEVNRYRLVAPQSPYMLSAGSIIPASLITGLRSDLPGFVAAQVTENVFDSATGRFLLVPQGARLIGNYDSVVAFGQRRALVVWQRIVMPDGSAIRLDNEPATDPSGYAGVADQIDFHSWAMLKGVAISTLLGAGTNVSLTGGSDLVQAVRQSAQQNAATAGNQITARNLDIQPTITIRPGFRIRLLVHRDLILEPWRN